MPKWNKSSYLFLVLVFIQLAGYALAGSAQQSHVQLIIDANKAPEGVVFEIVNRDKHYLDWALKEAEFLSQKLRNKYPQLDIAIVSHGSEQFALMSDKLTINAPLHMLVKSLAESDINIHVCGTYAEHKGVDASEFSELVNVAAEGPAQIKDYLKLGYIKITLVKN